MTKPTIIRLFVGGLVAVFAGIALAVAAFALALAGGVFILDGPDVVGVQPTPYAWSLLGLGLLAVLTIIGGSIAGLVAWIGALLNTAQLDDKAWFLLLLLLGIFSFGLVAMLAYVIAGPDGSARTGRSIAAPVA